MLRQFSFALLLAALPLAFFTACSNDDDDGPQPANSDNELITTVRYTLTPATGDRTPVFVQFRDLDGDGGAAPVVTSSSADGKLTLDLNRTYDGRLLLLDESKSPVDTTSNEIRAEANDHLFFFTADPGALLTVSYRDRDTNSPALPVGLDTQVLTRDTPGSGTLRVVLRHQPGGKDGTSGPGDTDVDLVFPVVLR